MVTPVPETRKGALACDVTRFACSHAYSLRCRSSPNFLLRKGHDVIRISPIRVAAVAVVVALPGFLIIGCGSGSKPSPAAPRPTASTGDGTGSRTAPAQSSDYTRLLIRASELNAPEPFTATPAINNSNGQPGATTPFRNQDGTHVVIDSIQILADPAAALGALESAKATRYGYVHGMAEPIAIGAGGATISGPSPDAAKGVTLLLFMLFTEGRAFVEVEFDGPSDPLVPPDFVTDTGQKQDAAIKNGLAG